MNNNYSIRFRIWIDKEDESFLGKGRIILLEKIKETGSITNAAKSIKMSYRQAWQLVEDMNKASKLPLVKKILGGKNGSGAELTDEGEKVILEFYKLENEIKNFINKIEKRIKI